MGGSSTLVPVARNSYVPPTTRRHRTVRDERAVPLPEVRRETSLEIARKQQDVIRVGRSVSECPYIFYLQTTPHFFPSVSVPTGRRKINFSVSNGHTPIVSHKKLPFPGEYQPSKHSPSLFLLRKKFNNTP